MTLSRLRQLGWASLLLGCTALFVVLWVQVNSVKSEVRMAERKLVALQTETQGLEMEFETRASQAQLAAWNAVDFGYRPPAAEQFLDGEQELAAFGLPRAEGAPDPIRVAQNRAGAKGPEFPDMVSPLTGKPSGDDTAQHEKKAEATSQTAIRVPMRAALP